MTTTRDGTPRPQGESQPRSYLDTKSHHARWQRSLADDIDLVIVDRLIAGQPVAGHSIYERREAVRRLHQHGATARHIARTIGVTERTIQRDLAALGLAATDMCALRRQHAQQRREKLPVLLADGLTITRMAICCGVSRSVIQREIRRIREATG